MLPTLQISSLTNPHRLQLRPLTEFAHRLVGSSRQSIEKHQVSSGLNPSLHKLHPEFQLVPAKEPFPH